MQFKSDNLIRQTLEIQSLELHSLKDFFFQMQDCTFHGTEGVFTNRVRHRVFGHILVINFFSFEISCLLIISDMDSLELALTVRSS